MTAPEMGVLESGFYLRDARSVACDLLGRYLVRSANGECLAVARIVETEAYLGVADAASHAAGGRRTARTSTMYRQGGVAYVYLIYGIHHCLNVVVAPEGEAQAVLIRAGEAIEGMPWMARNRGLEVPMRPGDIGGGPGKLCKALAVDRSFDGASLLAGDLVLTTGLPVEAAEIVSGRRVGVDYAGEAALWKLRFALRGHPEMSRPILR